MSFTSDSTFTPEQLLHDRATRGEILAPAEQAQLDEWYTQLEQQEMNVLFGEEQPILLPSKQWQDHLTILQQQIDLLLSQLSITMARIQSLTEQNNSLRTDVLKLRVKATQQLILELT